MVNQWAHRCYLPFLPRVANAHCRHRCHSCARICDASCVGPVCSGLLCLLRLARTVYKYLALSPSFLCQLNFQQRLPTRLTRVVYLHLPFLPSPFFTTQPTSVSSTLSNRPICSLPLEVVNRPPLKSLYLSPSPVNFLIL